MGIHLPPPIDLYFSSENAHDRTVLDQCFTASAIVRDEGKTIEGLAAIKAWRIETGKKVQSHGRAACDVGAGWEGHRHR